MGISSFKFLSKELGMQTDVKIILPTLYMDDIIQRRGQGVELKPGMKYQVLYLLHGGSGDEGDFLNYTKIASYAEANRLAVVMPCGYLSRYTDWPGFSQYYKYISEELPRVMECLFPISNKREDKFIGGFSMGAAGAMKTALLNPDKYAAVVVMSGSVVQLSKERKGGGLIPAPLIADDAEVFDRTALENKIDEYLANGVELPKFSISWGGGPFDPNGRSFDTQTVAFLQSRGIEVDSREIPGGNHDYELCDQILRHACYEWLPLRRSVIYPDEA